MTIASLSPSITEILFRLGLGDQIVCTDQFSDYPEAAGKLPHLKDHQAVSAEALRQHNPEIIFTSTVVQHQLSHQLQAAQLPVVHFDPRTLADMYECIRRLGVLFEREQEASVLIRQMQEGLNTVKKKAALLPRRAKVYVEEWPSFAEATVGRHSHAYASGNWVPEIVRLAGGEQIDAAAAGELSPEVRLQQVEAWNPDLIVLSWCGFGRQADAKQIFAQREEWQQLPAVQNGAVHMLDDSLLNRHGPRLVEGAQRLYGWMFEILH